MPTSRRRGKQSGKQTRIGKVSKQSRRSIRKNGGTSLPELSASERNSLRASAVVAREYVTDSKKSEALLDRAKNLAERIETLKRVLEAILDMIDLVRAWWSGKYKCVPTRTILSVLAAIVYVVNPFDAVPDFIPFFGYLDDATVIAFVAKSIGKDLDAFRAWRTAGTKTGLRRRQEQF